MAIAKAQPKLPKVTSNPIYSTPAPKPKAPVVVKAKPVVVKPPARPVTAPLAPPNALQNVGSDAAQGYGGNSPYRNPGPNYGADLVGDPDYTEANARYEENVRLAHDQRKNRVRAALIKLGFQPGSADARALADVDPSTADLAANNSASAMAQLGLKRGTDRADLSAQLAGRGLLDSGALRGGENMVQSTYDQGILGATQDYLNEQNTALNDEATSLATGQSTYTAAKAAAAYAAAKNPLFTPTYDAGEQGDTLAPGQGVRPDQTPVLAKAPLVPTPQPVRPPAKPFAPPAGTKFYAYRNQVPLRPGQTLKFFNGRYYAG